MLRSCITEGSDENYWNVEACCDQPARGSLCRKQKSPRSVHAKLTKAKISLDVARPRATCGVKEKLCSDRFAGVSPAKANFPFADLRPRSRSVFGFVAVYRRDKGYLCGRDCREPDSTISFWRPPILNAILSQLAPRRYLTIQ